MVGKLQRRNDRLWYWQEADPKTRTIVGALHDTGSLSPSRRPFSFEKQTVAAAMEGFGVSLDYIGRLHDSGIRQIAELRGIEYVEAAVPKAIVDALRQGEANDTRSVIAELGRCASRQFWAQELASEAAEQVLGNDDPYDALPALRALSTLAVHRLALEKGPASPLYHLAELSFRLPHED